MNRFRSHSVWFVLFSVYFLFLTAPSAHAYLDPGTGSYIFQVVIGAFLGVAVAVKLFWRRLWGFVSRRPGPGRNAETPVETGQPTKDL
jgi:hypothetical protein